MTLVDHNIAGEYVFCRGEHLHRKDTEKLVFDSFYGSCLPPNVACRSRFADSPLMTLVVAILDPATGATQSL